jgi:hypothetical protein
MMQTELREAVQQDEQRPFAGLDVVQALIADVGIPLAKLGPNVRQHAGGRHGISFLESTPWSGLARSVAPV